MAFTKIPFSVQKAAETYQLGKFRAGYRTSILWIITSTLGCAFLYLVGWAMLSDLIDHPEEGDKLLVLICALAFFAFSTSLLSRVIWKAWQRIYLFKRGFVMMQGGQVQVVPWEPGTTLWKSKTREPRIQGGPRWGLLGKDVYLYTFQRADGYRIKFGNTTSNVSMFGFLASEDLTQELVPLALSAIRSGQELLFPPFSLSQQGLRKGNNALPWTQVQRIVDCGDFMYVQTERRAWGETRVAEIPNFGVLVGVAKEMIQQAPQTDEQASRV
jgi:hypothetical protein